MSGGWWCISEESLMEMLNAVADGEEPGVVYAEAYANSDQEQMDADDD